MAEPSWDPADSAQSGSAELADDLDSIAGRILGPLEPANLRLPLPDRLTRLLDAVLWTLEAEIGSILLLASDSRMRIAAARGLPSAVLTSTCVAWGESISGYVLRAGEGLLVRNIERDDRFRRRNDERYYTSSFVSAPLVIERSVAGVINVNNKRARTCFGASDLAVLEAVGERGSEILRSQDLAAWGATVSARIGTPPSD